MGDEPKKIIVYGTSWCPDCRRAKKILDQNAISYLWVDIDSDAEGRKFVEKTNHGNRTVPTIVFPDGNILTEPSDSELTAKLKG
jgi:glutaredoxin-like protein